MRRFRAIPLLAAALTCTLAAHAREPHGDSAAGRFDYYLLSLSWSPSYCATHTGTSEECGKGYGFVLHGLWPQNRDGSWPQHCRGNGPDEATIARTLAFMPSRQLVEHEWQTHGTCSGLDAAAYFALADRAFAAVRIPPALKAPAVMPNLSAEDVAQAFEQVNPGLDASMISVACHGSDLAEVRICLSRDDLKPQACGGRVRNTCRAGNLRIPAVK
ncbi:MAG TPA: ribonuclease T2 [Rudaea sp.]|nr:ribonuclease T2 [Rudaea sp.]